MTFNNTKRIYQLSPILEVESTAIQSNYSPHTQISPKYTVEEGYSRKALSHHVIAVHSNFFCNPGRLGNKISMVAAAFGEACRNNATLVLPTGELDIDTSLVIALFSCSDENLFLQGS